MKRKVFLLLFLSALILALLPLVGGVFAAEEIVISSAEQLYAFAEEANGGASYQGKTVRLGKDVTLGGESRPWVPVSSFDGTFDGGGHTVEGLYIDTDKGNQALFASLKKGGIVKNLTLRGEITSSGTTLAGIVASNAGRVENCASEIRLVATGGSLVHFCGGVVADNSGEVLRCCFTGRLEKEGGSAVGGVVGRNLGGTVKSCYSTGEIKSPSGSHVGGVIGQNRGNASVQGLYFAGEVSGKTNVGAVIGQDQTPDGSRGLYYLAGSVPFGVGSTGNTDGSLSEEEMKSGLLLSLLGEDFAEDAKGKNGGFPVLFWQIEAETGEEQTPSLPEQTPRAKELVSLIEAAVESAKAHGGEGGGSLLGSEAYRRGASSTDTDWMALAMARFSLFDGANGGTYFIDDGEGYRAYLSALEAYVEKAYEERGGLLHTIKATEWHRAALTVRALGGNPARFGEVNGEPIDLIRDGSYECVVSGGPGRQGINGWIFGLISLDASCAEVPAGASYSREVFITEILSRQLTDGVGGNLYGGWALSGYGESSDIDITAMALQALAPYYPDGTVYSFRNTASGETREVTVRQCVEEALALLSSRMDETGGFSSWGSKTWRESVRP